VIRRLQLSEALGDDDRRTGQEDAVVGRPGDGEPAAAGTAGPKTVIANLFEWNWNSVAAECTNYLGPRGYGYVQVSPPQENVTGSQWWTSYQPVSYKIESKLGTRAEF
jgi:alpha-amylase